MPFYGTIYLWQSDLVIRSAPSSKNFMFALKQLRLMDCDRKLLETEWRGGGGCRGGVVEWLALQWLVIWDLRSTPIEFRPQSSQLFVRLLFFFLSFPLFLFL